MPYSILAQQISKTTITAGTSAKYRIRQTGIQKISNQKGFVLFIY
jgi:hypothetical protein